MRPAAAWRVAADSVVPVQRLERASRPRFRLWWGCGEHKLLGPTAVLWMPRWRRWQQRQWVPVVLAAATAATGWIPCCRCGGHGQPHAQRPRPGRRWQWQHPPRWSSPDYQLAKRRSQAPWAQPEKRPPPVRPGVALPWLLAAPLPLLRGSAAAAPEEGQGAEKVEGQMGGERGEARAKRSMCQAKVTD